MRETSRVALLLIPFAGFDRGLVDGIVRYTQLHEPWVYFLSGDFPNLPLPESDSVSGKLNLLKQAAEFSGAAPLPNLRRWKATGVIARIPNTKVFRQLLALQLPTIGIDVSFTRTATHDPLGDISQIRADSRSAGRMAADHFLDRGFRHFAFCGYQGRIWSDERRDGFCSRLLEAGYSSQVYEPARTQPWLSWEREQSLVKTWLKTLPRPAAVLACNDIRGRQVLEACQTVGLCVPDDVAVLGVDDDRLICNLSNPPLSSIALNLERAGYQAAELLNGLMSGAVRGPHTVVVDPLWVVSRRSTDVIATDDREVAAALRFIRNQARGPIGVEDVVSETGISRRNLEIRFRRVLGRSVRDEIQRVRLVHTRQLLLETNLPVERIAQLAGFRSLSYLSNVFRREVGMRVAEFRRQMRGP
jgi:LacI family transcriptional regulator